jgi:very-short-patch-repair endonuclease
MAKKGATPDSVIAAIAARQHGTISTRQLNAAGLSAAAIVNRVGNGRLHRIHQGVYAVGHRGLSQQGLWLAAVLACCREGRGAFLSHRSAAELWGLLSPGRGLLDVSVPGNGGRKRRGGVRIHRSRTLVPAETTRRHGIPVTDPTRTIHDLRRSKPSRGGANDEQLRRAIRQADVLGLPFEDTVADRTRSDLELLFLRICREHCLPPPEVNVEIGGMEVDFLWRERRLIVETDGYRFHRGRAAFENDRRRDLAMRAHGFEIVRVSYLQVTEEPTEVVSVLTCLLRG